MPALKINFARHSSPLRSVRYVLLLLSIATAVFLLNAYHDRFTEFENWGARLSRLQEKQNKSIRGDSDQNVKRAQLHVELKNANTIIEHLSFPWNKLFREIESSANEQVAVLDIEPDSEKHEIRIKAEAKNFEAMLSYVKQLQTVNVFRHAHIVSHHLRKQDSESPVRFVVRAEWTVRRD